MVKSFWEEISILGRAKVRIYGSSRRLDMQIDSYCFLSIWHQTSTYNEVRLGYEKKLEKHLHFHTFYSKCLTFFFVQESFFVGVELTIHW